MKGGKAGKPVAWRLQGKLGAKHSRATTAIAMPSTPERPECSPDKPPGQARGHSPDTAQPAQAPAMRVPPPPPAPATVRVVSPCVRQCTLNEQDFCMGCGRALADITAWMAMSDEDKTACIERGRANLARIGRPLPPYPPYPLTPVAPRRR
jgi:predicted Fe-S protein YdhL (DUF1289 family)